MKRKVVRSVTFIMLYAMLQPVAVSASELVQLSKQDNGLIEQTTQENETEPSSTESAVEPVDPPDTETEMSTTESTSSSTDGNETESSTATTKPGTSTTASSRPQKPSAPASQETATNQSQSAGKQNVAEPAGQATMPPVTHNWVETEAIYSSTRSSVDEVDFMANATTAEFVKTIGPLARKIAAENNLYASVMIAQAILESGSGHSALALAPNYNLFGIKGEYRGETIVMPTQEDNGAGTLSTVTAGFRQYPSYKESLADYADLLTTGITGNPNFYRGAWRTTTKNYREATAFLTGKYATDVAYASKLNGLIATYKLTKYDDSQGRDKVIGNAQLTEVEKKIGREAMKQLDIPYQWGGTTPNGFDCSGLVQYVYQEALGLELPRVTSQQELVGQEVELDELRAGDLLYFGERTATHHVGIYLAKGLFIHAPEPGDVVKITALKEFKPDFAKRVLGNIR